MKPSTKNILQKATRIFFVLSLVIPTRVQLTSTGGRLILRSVNLDIHWCTSTELKEDIQQFKKTDYYEWNFA